MNKFYTELSKIMSFALRHMPEKYHLVMNDEGWTDIHILASSIKRNHNEYGNITIADLLFVIENNEKKRHEFRNPNLIRAVYGHSKINSVTKKPQMPPLILYHGTSALAAKNIINEGIKSLSRQYVHLSENTEVVKKVALRKSREIIIFEIKYRLAYNEGVLFYHENDVWLTEFIPSCYISQVLNP